MMKRSLHYRSLLTIGTLSAMMLACGPEPASIRIKPDSVVLEGVDATKELKAQVLDKDGKVIKGDFDIVWFSEDTDHIKLAANGTVKAVASGEAEVEVELVGTDIKKTVPIRVKIASSIAVSHEKLRLWTGQVKENVWAEVRSEKDAFIEGYLPKWVSEDPEIVKVEPIVDPKRRQSWVRMTGMKSGNTFIAAMYENMSKRIRVAVFDEDEEVALDGTRIPKDAAKEGEPDEDESGKEKKGEKSKKK
jgi:hypothetical protein